MTHEEFMHICLKIRKGDVTVDIPCCANCKYYGKVLEDSKLIPCDEQPGLKWEYTYKWICSHGVEADDPFVAAWIEMQPEDFCSRWEARDGN